VRNGEFVSEFASEKVCYFLQRFGAEGIFKLDFQPNFYGPYSGKVKHVLYYLNGSYISGYSSKDKKPFEELGLMMDAEKEVSAFLETEDNSQLREIVQKTKKILSGFYSSFALELLSSIDFIAQKEKISDINSIKTSLENWSNRKKTMFSDDRFLEKGIKKLEMAQLI